MTVSEGWFLFLVPFFGFFGGEDPQFARTKPVTMGVLVCLEPKIREGCQ
jgi:hypothetical protein